MNDQTDFLAALETALSEDGKRYPLNAHLANIELCWPEWHGPEPGGFAEAHELFAASVTHGDQRYHYMAPVRLLFEVEPDVWLAVVDYQPGACCWHLNGELLRLPLLNIWPPVRRLLSDRNRCAA
jgi:hypothetical protein